MAVPVIKRNPNYCCDLKVFLWKLNLFYNIKIYKVRESTVIGASIFDRELKNIVD